MFLIGKLDLDNQLTEVHRKLNLRPIISLYHKFCSQKFYSAAML